MKVKNMISNSGNAVANQFIITDYDVRWFQSYDSIIVMVKRESNSTSVYLDERYWDYSRTTGRYRNLFLGETKKETEARINSGEYRLCNLNKED